MDKPKLYPWNKEEIKRTLVNPLGLDKNTDSVVTSLVDVVSRMIEKTTTRTNRVSEKAVLEYFSLADKNRTLPNPAVVPVKFYQTNTKETATVPAQTQVSTLTSDLKKPVLFETTDSLTVVKPDLEMFIVADFDRNRYKDKSDLIETIVDTPEKLYNTDTPFTYDIHIHHPLLDEIKPNEEYWVQILFEFDKNYVTLKDSSLESTLFDPKNAEAFDRKNPDTIENVAVDMGLFDISLTYEDSHNTEVSIRLKSLSENIREIDNNSSNKTTVIPTVFTKPLRFKTGIGERTVTAYNGKEETTLHKKFITISLEIKNREYFTYYSSPLLNDIKLKLFYKPVKADGFLQFDQNSDSEPISDALFIPKYEDITNVEQAYYNDKKLDLSKPFKPFGDTPKLGDTFSFSSRLFSMKGKPCEINTLLLGYLEGSVFQNEQSDEHKVYSDDVMLGWEYFNGKEWKILGTVENRVKSRKPLKRVDEHGCITKQEITYTDINNYKVTITLPINDEEELSPQPSNSLTQSRFFDGGKGFTNSAHKSLFDDEYNKYPTISFIIPNDIAKVELNKRTDWWIRVRILRGGSYSRPIKFDSFGRITQSAIIAPPCIRSFTINQTPSEVKLLSDGHKGSPAISCESVIKQNAFTLEENKSLDNNLNQTPVIKTFTKSDTEESERMIFLGFTDSEFLSTPKNLFFSITPDLSMVLSKEHLETENGVATLSNRSSDGSNRLNPTFIWQYWNGEEWKSLEVTDRTEGLTTAQSLEFSIPHYSRKRTLFNKPLHWIRGFVKKESTLLLARDHNGNPLTCCLNKKNDQVVPFYDSKGTLIMDNPEYISPSQAPFYRDHTLQEEIFPYFKESITEDKEEEKRSLTLAYYDANKLYTTEDVLNTQLKIEGINQNMVLAESFETIHNEILGNSDGSPSQKLRFVSKPVAANPIILIKEKDILTPEEHQLVLRDEAGNTTFINEVDPAIRETVIREQNYEDCVSIIPGSKGDEIWVEWQEVADFSHSGPQDRHYVIDHVNGTIQFGDNIHGRIPDKGIKSIEAAKYRFGGGAGANINTGEIQNIVTAIPYISGVKNVTTAKGGDNLESNSDIFTRATKAVAAFDRAVIEQDYETLALAASGGIKRVKAYAGLRPDGVHQLGWVTLVLISDQLGSRPVPSAEFMQNVEHYLAKRCQATIVNDYAQFNPIHTQRKQESIYNNTVSVVPANYVTTWIEASISFNNENDERTLIPHIRQNLSTFLHAIHGGTSGEGWSFGRDVYVSEMSKIISEMEGVKEVKELRLKANQMRFILPLEKGISIPEHELHGRRNIPAGSLVTTTYPKAMKDGSAQDIEFSFVSSKPIEHDSKEIVVEGFKEGDIISLKTVCNVQHENNGFIKQEKRVGRARVTSVETHFFGGFVKTDSGDIIQGVSHFRIYLQPMSLKLQGSSKKSGLDNRLIVENTLSNDSLLIAESIHGSIPLTGEVKKARTYVKQLLTMNGSIYRRMGCEIHGSNGDRNDDMRHSENQDVKGLTQLGDEEIIAIDVAIPNLWGTVSDDELMNGSIPPVNIYPLGRDDNVLTTTKGELQSQTKLSLDSENIFYYDELGGEQNEIDSDRFMLIPEYTEQVFLGPTDLPTPGYHRVITDILLSEGEEPIAHTSVENSTEIPNSQSHIWYKTLFTKDQYNMVDFNATSSIGLEPIEKVIYDIHKNAVTQKEELESLLANLPENAPNRKEIQEEINLQNALLSMGQDIIKTTDPKSMTLGAFIPTAVKTS